MLFVWITSLSLLSLKKQSSAYDDVDDGLSSSERVLQSLNCAASIAFDEKRKEADRVWSDNQEK
jgi:hypothetical protein